MSEGLLVRHCAPTLAGLKTGNLFSTFFDDYKLLCNEIEKMNKILNEKGVVVYILKTCGNRALIFVYRPTKLKKYLSRKAVREFLYESGYKANDLVEYIEKLSHKICLNAEFPHEIGLFLGYPLEDIKAFIANKGKNSKCTGCWKVYYNEAEAVRTFDLYKKCTDVYCRKFNEGLTIERLTIVA